MISFRSFKPILIILVALILLPVIYFVGHLGYNYFSGNIHTVIPGQVYRTAQLNEARLTHVTKKYHLKSIINLRGVWPSNPWYQVESRFVKTHHLFYFPIELSAYSLPKKKLLQKLVHILQTAPKPYAFHCEGGADRTGLASGISIILFKKHATILDIKRQISWHYNAISSKTVGYQVMRNYFAWLKQHHYKQTKSHFLSWVFSSAKMVPYKGHFWV